MNNPKNKKIYSISFSEYSSFNECPHKWNMVYGLRFPSDDNEELFFGTCMHAVIEELILKPQTRKKSFFPHLVKGVMMEKLKDIKDVNFLKRFNDSALPYVFMKQLVELLNQLDLFERFDEYEFVEVEHKLDGFYICEFEDMIFVFKGYIDLVLRHKVSGRLLFIDWKSSRKKWDIKKKIKDNPDFFTQLCLYKLFYSIKFNIPMETIDVKFHNMPREEAAEQKSFDGIINADYITHIHNKLKDVCKKIYEVKLLELNKAKITTKKNFCYRCKYNLPSFCNDTDEFQVVV